MAIQLKATDQLLVSGAVSMLVLLTFEAVDKTLKCDYSNEAIEQ